MDVSKQASKQANERVDERTRRNAVNMIPGTPKRWIRMLCYWVPMVKLVASSPCAAQGTYRIMVVSSILPPRH